MSESLSPKSLEELLNNEEVQYKKGLLDPWVSSTYVNIFIINLVMKDRKSQSTLSKTLILQTIIDYLYKRFCDPISLRNPELKSKGRFLPAGLLRAFIIP